MADRSHLRPAVTVDRNGTARTVYVNPGISRPSRSFAAPSLGGGHGGDEDEGGVPEEWEQTGLSDWENWRDNNFDPDDAEDWNAAGFDGDEACAWRDAEFEPNDAAEWVHKDFTVVGARLWTASGFDVDSAAEWIDLGFDPADAESWNGESFDADDAKEWQDEDFTPADAKGWRDENFDPTAATEWKDAGFTDAAVAAEWRSEARRSNGADLTDLHALATAGAEASDGPMWLTVLADVQGRVGRPEQTMESVYALLSNVNPSAAYAYADYFPFSQWGMLAEEGIEYEAVRPAAELYSDILARDEEAYEGEDAETASTDALTEAVEWVRGIDRFPQGKIDLLRALAERGESPRDYTMLRMNESRTMEWSGSEGCLRAVTTSERWVRESGEEDPTAKTAAFETFYGLLRENGGSGEIDRLVDEHGAAKLAAAVAHGLRTEAQIVNFLEVIPVAAISEGAL